MYFFFSIVPSTLLKSFLFKHAKYVSSKHLIDAILGFCSIRASSPKVFPVSNYATSMYLSSNSNIYDIDFSEGACWDIFIYVYYLFNSEFRNGFYS